MRAWRVINENGIYKLVEVEGREVKNYDSDSTMPRGKYLEIDRSAIDWPCGIGDRPFLFEYQYETDLDLAKLKLSNRCMKEAIVEINQDFQLFNEYGKTLEKVKRTLRTLVYQFNVIDQVFLLDGEQKEGF